jgi:hypothetical protein
VVCANILSSIYIKTLAFGSGAACHIISIFGNIEFEIGLKMLM